MGKLLIKTLEPFADNFILRAEGIVEWKSPKFIRSGGTDPEEIIVISAGIHGNETAPVELLDELVESFASGSRPPAAPCLFILGNLDAMKPQTRFLETNLNRLFGESSESPEQCASAVAAGGEQLRALLIQSAVRQFQKAYPASRMIHLDLHTAIRDSQFERFAVLPPLLDQSSAEKESLLNEILRAADIPVCVRHENSGSTFSAWTARAFDAISATLELGKVRPFGENDLTRLKALRRTIEICCQGDSAGGKKHLLALLVASNRKNVNADASGSPLQHFEVVHEIIRDTESFELNLDEDVANFTLLPVGTTLYSDFDRESGRTRAYVVEREELRIVFPNANVELGHRAGLLIAPVAVSNGPDRP